MNIWSMMCLFQNEVFTVRSLVLLAAETVTVAKLDANVILVTRTVHMQRWPCCQPDTHTYMYVMDYKVRGI